MLYVTFEIDPSEYDPDEFGATAVQERHHDGTVYVTEAVSDLRVTEDHLSFTSPDGDTLDVPRVGTHPFSVSATPPPNYPTQAQQEQATGRIRTLQVIPVTE
jgi:hypothetical protein